MEFDKKRPAKRYKSQFLTNLKDDQAMELLFAKVKMIVKQMLYADSNSEIKAKGI